MFTNLLESQHRAQRYRGGTLFSVFTHGALILLAIQLTTHAAQEVERIVQEKLVFADLKKEQPPQPKEEPPKLQQQVVQMKELPAKGFQVLAAPIKIPDVLPDIDLSKKVTDEADFTGKGVAGGVAKGVTGGVVRKPDEQTQGAYFEYEVEKHAAALPDNRPPRYPETLRSASIEGTVVVRYVVDTTGRADMRTVVIMSATHPVFAEAVKSVMPTWRFYPAEIGDRKVRVLVEQPIEFHLGRER